MAFEFQILKDSEPQSLESIDLVVCGLLGVEHSNKNWAGLKECPQLNWFDVIGWNIAKYSNPEPLQNFQQVAKEILKSYVIDFLKPEQMIQETINVESGWIPFIKVCLELDKLGYIPVKVK